MTGKLKGVKATNLFRKLVPDLKWCDNCGIPLVGYRRCPLCNFETRSIRVTPPGDVRPAFDRDVEVVKQAIEFSVGVKAVTRFVSFSSLMLLNKVQAIDVADEVIVCGYSIGIREFDIYRRRWVFKPGYAGAKLVVDEKLGFYAITSRDRLREYETLRRSEVLEGDIPPPGAWVAIASRDGREYGVAKVLQHGDLRVYKVWRTLPKDLELTHRPASITKAMRANESRLTELEKEAIEFLQKVRKLGTTRVSISGGKDSTVTAYLASLTGIRRAIFVDTGLEFPETIQTVEKIAKSLDLELDTPSAGSDFWRAVEIYGPPARDYRWCCKVCKLAPLAKVSEKISGRSVNVVGQRQYESTSRALAGRLARSASTAGDLIAAPIQRWTSLEVFMFIELRRLPLNPLYMRGYERIGCFMCPTSRLAELEIVKESHRELWRRWEEVLERFAKRLRLPREWIDYGLWRWRFGYPAEVRHLAKKLNLKPFEILDRIALDYVSTAIEPSGGDTELCIALFTDLELRNLNRIANTLIAVDLRAELDNNVVHIVAKHGRATIYSYGKIEIRAKDYDYLERLVKRVLSAIFMAVKCFGCGLCAYACPHQAIRYGVIDPSRCRRCARCTAVCPAASQLPKHGIYMLKRVMGTRDLGRKTGKRGS